jgi:hypothetical protein
MNNGDPIKPDTTQNESASIPDAASGSEIVNPLPGSRDIGVNQADHSDQKTGEADKPKQPSQQDILDRIRAGELWMIVFTAVVALTTVAQFIQSGCNNRSTSKQVDKIIAATDTQACAAKSFATSANNINAGIGTAVGKLNLQAEKLDANVTQASRLADDTEKANANIINAERPWMGAALTVDGFVVGKTPTYSIISINSGKRPAKVTLAQSLAIDKDYGNNPVYKPWDQKPSTTIVVPGQGMAMMWKDDNPIVDPIKQEVMTALDGGFPFHIYIRIEYTDISTSKKYWTHACWRYNKAGTGNSGAFSNCSEYNDAK